MELPDIQGKIFPGCGRCIYCGSTGGTDGLRSEHIIPFSLGGKTEIQQASCKECERVTSYLDGYLSRHTYYEYRAHAGTQTRNPKERPTAFPAHIVINGQEEIRSFPTADHPYYLAMPVWGLPGILRGDIPTEVFSIQKAHIYSYIPDTLRENLQISEDMSLQVRGMGRINHSTFARALAKIAYCHAILVYGFNGFRKMATAKLILGQYPYVPHFVGCELKDPPPPEPAGRLHWVDFRTVQYGRFNLIVGSIRLFAHSGTKEAGMPIYRVVVGAPKLK